MCLLCCVDSVLCCNQLKVSVWCFSRGWTSILGFAAAEPKPHAVNTAQPPHRTLHAPSQSIHHHRHWYTQQHVCITAQYMLRCFVTAAAVAATWQQCTHCCCHNVALLKITTPWLPHTLHQHPRCRPLLPHTLHCHLRCRHRPPRCHPVKAPDRCRYMKCQQQQQRRRDSNTMCV